MLPSFNFHMLGAKRALSEGRREYATALVRRALGIASRMNDDQRKGLCLRILKWLAAAGRRMEQGITQ